MFGIDSYEFLLFAVIALVIIGPKDMPKAMRAAGRFIGKARGVARHFRSGFDSMVREAELEEMERKWKAENERIMREYSGDTSSPHALEEAEPTSTTGAPPVAVTVSPPADKRA
jgi:sec-independent protein translocase protein TatB